MKTFELLLIIMCICSVAWGMQTMTVTTGQGYLSYNSQIIADYIRPAGDYPLCDGLSYNEVNDVSNLNAQSVNDLAYVQFFNTVGCH